MNGVWGALILHLSSFDDQITKQTKFWFLDTYDATYARALGSKDKEEKESENQNGKSNMES